MSNDAESLDELFSFLSQIDLPAGLTPFDDDQVESVRSMELLPSSVTEGRSIEELIELQEFQSVEFLTRDEEDDKCTPVASEDYAMRMEEKPTRIRISRKQQIDSLRGEVHELKVQLQMLLQQWQQFVARDHNGRIISRRGSMWKDIALRQRERRENSEQENAKLRDMLQIQIHEARTLRRLLKRRSKIAMLKDMFGMKRQKLTNVSVPDDNAQVFDDMLQDIDDIYVDVDALFVETGLYSLPCPGQHRDAKSNVTNGQFLELLQRHLVPFDLRTTMTAMWGVLRQTNMVQKFSQRIQFHAHHIEETANTMKTSFYVETVNVGDVKGAQFRKVVRKYVETDRVVFVCKNLMELIVHGKGNTSGFYTKRHYASLFVMRSTSQARSRISTVILVLHDMTRDYQSLVLCAPQ